MRAFKTSGKDVPGPDKRISRAGWIESFGPCCECGSNESLRVVKENGRQVSDKIWKLPAPESYAYLEACKVVCRSCYMAGVKGEKPEHSVWKRDTTLSWKRSTGS
jgi:hypothetical protein